MRAAFLPHNYMRTLYQQLHNLKQGTQSIDEYTREFYQLVARVDLADSEDQLVSRYIGGMRQQFQDTLNLFDPISVSEAHQRALHLEKTMNRRTNMVSNSSGNRLPPVAPPYGAITQSTQGKCQVNQANPQPSRTTASSSGPRCFKCGEAGHRMADCKKGGWYGKGLFIESEECTDDHLNTFEQEAVYDAEEEEEYVQGDDGPLLVTRRRVSHLANLKARIGSEAISFKLHVLWGARYVDLLLILEAVKMWYQKRLFKNWD